MRMFLVLMLTAGVAYAQQRPNQPVQASVQTYKVMALPNTDGPPTTATNDWVLLNGSTLQGSTRNLDAAPRTLSLSGYSAWAQATVNTSGADVVLGAGLGKRSIAMTRANCATDTVTVVRNVTSTALVEGTDWNRGATDTTAATSLASAINALSGVTADSSGGTVRVQKDPNDNTMGPAALITITTDDATCAAITSGTDGTLRLLGTVSVPTLTITTMTGSNGGTWANTPNNAWTLTENSEDLIQTFTSNAATYTSSTGVASQTWTGISLATDSTITSTRATDIGWSVVAGANTACNTTCTSACVFGVNTAATEADIVACTDATADECLCAGAN